MSQIENWRNRADRSPLIGGQRPGYQPVPRPPVNPRLERDTQRFNQMQRGLVNQRFQDPNRYSREQIQRGVPGRGSPMGYNPRQNALQNMYNYDQGRRNFYTQRADQNRLNQMRYDSYRTNPEGRGGLFTGSRLGYFSGFGR